MAKSQDKGKRFERAIAKQFSQAFDIDVRRTPNSGGLDIKGDLRNLHGILENFVIECKCQEKMNIWKCLEQTMNQAGSKTGLLVFSRNYESNYACLYLDDFINLLLRINKALTDLRAISDESDFESVLTTVKDLIEELDISKA